VTAARLSFPGTLLAVVVVVPIVVVLLADVLRQLMNLLSEAFVEVPAVLPVEEVAVLPVVELLLLFFVFAAKTELLRLPAVISVIAMTMAMMANAIDVLFVYIALVCTNIHYNILTSIFFTL
jgi:hypothetical protein